MELRDCKSVEDVFSMYRERIAAILGFDNFTFDRIDDKPNIEPRHGLTYADPQGVVGSWSLRVPSSIQQSDDGIRPVRSLMSMRMSMFPGCCGLVVSHNNYIFNTEQRRKGLGSLTHLMRLDIARMYKYTAVLCTDKQSNEAEMQILKKNNWNMIGEFKNKRTNNLVGIYMVTL